MMNTRSDPVVVFIDADNTLWDTDGVFAGAQLDLLAGIERALGVVGPIEDRLAFVRLVDQSIAERHHAGLRYPPKLLANAIALALKGVSPETAARQAWKTSEAAQLLPDDEVARLESAFVLSLRTLPPLRPGVREGLTALRESGCTIFVITEGARDRILRIAQDHRLVGLIDRVIEAPKSAQVYTRALKLIKQPVNAFMVGDQLDRDIGPAKAAGLTTIYFPGGFRPRWEPAEAAVRPEYRIESFSDVPDIVLAECRREGPRRVAARE
jgi:putative hydrolase of the HAD superfamily